MGTGGSLQEGGEAGRWAREGEAGGARKVGGVEGEIRAENCKVVLRRLPPDVEEGDVRELFYQRALHEPLRVRCLCARVSVCLSGSVCLG